MSQSYKPGLPAAASSLPAVAAPGPNVANKCSMKGCMANVNTSCHPCSVSCTKFIHGDCYKKLLEKHKVGTMKDPANGAVLYCCSKMCYNALDKLYVQQHSSRIPWDKDGRAGPDDPNTSLRILLNWLMEESNYSKFRGHKNNGTRKTRYGQIISDMMRQAGCRVERSAEAVVKKIQEIESKFCAAHDWANNTGQGVKETDGNATFEELVMRRCKWYFDLLPVMGDRSKAMPAATTETVDSLVFSSDDEEAKSDGEDDKSSSGLSSSYSSQHMAKKKPSPPSNQSAKRATKKRQTSSASSSVASKKRQQAGNFTDMEYLIEYLEGSTQESQAHVREVERHNKRMEELEEMKLKASSQAMDWQAKVSELEYKKKLLTTKMELERDGFDKESILAMFPDMAPLFPN